ncbi:uncharacterized protein M6B38_122570 [Iris pallida]|uniref:Uncharacterized protein n=1 Tax=Iris pallida TaxID=29817 RepID=A0AAX6H350_IRIPA|nr:uncharacterized protein M6B38_122570 [Iris pallida]
MVQTRSHRFGPRDTTERSATSRPVQQGPGTVAPLYLLMSEHLPYLGLYLHLSGGLPQSSQIGSSSSHLRDQWIQLRFLPSSSR